MTVTNAHVLLSSHTTGTRVAAVVVTSASLWRERSMSSRAPVVLDLDEPGPGNYPPDHPVWAEVAAVLASLDRSGPLPSLEEQMEWLDDMRSNWSHNLDMLDDEPDSGA